MYLEKRLSKSSFVPLRGLNVHVRSWGTQHANASQPPLVMVHGWMDVSASFQFVVDALAQDRYVIAPDLRGFGLTTGAKVDNYWLPDYMADLDFLLDALCPGQVIDLVGHSLGGNIVMLYAGVRPERIRKLVNLEGFGMAKTRPDQAPGRYAKWMDELKALHRGDLDMQAYAEVSGVARRLMKTNPRLTPDKADWLARQWSAPNADGKWAILGDPAHKISNANLYQVEEALALYARITADTLVVHAGDNSLKTWWKGKYTLEEFFQRLQSVPSLKTANIDDAGHMLHHDQPEVLARLLEDFLAT